MNLFTRLKNINATYKKMSLLGEGGVVLDKTELALLGEGPGSALFKASYGGYTDIVKKLLATKEGQKQVNDGVSYIILLNSYLPFNCTRL